LDRRTFLLSGSTALLPGCVSVGGVAGPPAPAPVFRVGDRWVYNCSDGYRVPVTWVETHEVIAADAQGIDVRVTIVGETMNYTRTEKLVSPGVVSVGEAYDNTETRDFRAPMIRYRFPLTNGATWTQNLDNLNPQNQLVSTINRYVKVGGYEQVATAAGTFNAVTMRILMSVDDNNPFRFPTNCNYMVWWAADVGAMVKEYKYATYLEKGDAMTAVAVRAQNTTIELASYRRAPA
jgi:hypothetical protein